MHPEMALKELYTKIGERIKAFRDIREKTQADIADATKINRATISNIESGKQQVSILYLYLIAKALDTEITEFLPSIKELNITDEESLSILNEKLDEQGDNSIKNTILGALNKKPENDK